MANRWVRQSTSRKPCGYLLLALFLLFLLPAPPALAGEVKPSFDCSKTQSEAEKWVCGNTDLAALDVRLAKRYQAAVAVVKQLDVNAEAELRTLRATQRGWISGRDDCWKAEDLTACIRDSYLRREGELVARYILEKPVASASFACGGNPANTVDVQYFDTEQQSARLEYGDSIDVAVQVRTASGVRFDASFGRFIWSKGDQARFVWTQGEEQSCVLVE